ncbi:MAG: DNA topoisomerase 4 subunit A [Clostridiales bacterium]|nr:DNA topoisomerase 4 subunit A [Clostridiales bacterium]MBQ2768703.1 DNA topoisomerase 4 subunit A [Clostridia bacterium]
MARSKKEPEIIEPTGQLYIEPLDKVLHSSMLPYAEFVILDRALPRVEDGLKPVQRRILYTMKEMGLTPDKPHKKSARIVGDCMGKYHPHGDSSVYDAMVRMAQGFNMGKTLVNGHGNFGSVDGDPAAAMRYTEARMEPLALELLRDIDKETVSFSLNFDDSLKEPDVLPGRFPNLLVNGASGIAVGLATNIPTHNLEEVINGVVAYIDNPAISLEEMMEYIPSPDFPTGGIIIANELIQAYKTGRGKITLRAKITAEKTDNGKTNLIITELPYQVNKAQLLRKVVDLREEKKEELAGLDFVADESDRTGMRAVIRVKKDADVDAILKCLYKYTDLEVTFGINMVVIADGKPQQLGLMEIIRHYVKYQQQVIKRRTLFDLEQAEQRCHILEGMIIAVQNIDEVIAIIKQSESTADAKNNLMKRFEISDVQAQAILDLRLARLTKLEINKLEKELKELKQLIKKLKAISKSGELQLQVVKEEITEIKNAYPSPRKSKLVYTREEADGMLATSSEKKPGVKCVLAYTADHAFKVLTGKQVDGLEKPIEGKFKPQNLALKLLKTVTDKKIFAFTNYGNCHKLDISDPELECKLSDAGATLKELSKDAEEGENVVALFEVGEHMPYGNLMFFTKKGMIKKTEWAEYEQRKDSFPAIKLSENDELIAVEEETDEEDTIVMVTKGGICLNATKEDIPTQGRIAGGVRGIMLREDDEVILMSQINGEGEIIIATDEGKFKRVISSQIEPSKRYRKGSIIVGLRDGASVLCACYVTVPYMLAVVEKNGNVSELSSEDVFISVQSARAKKVARYAEDSVKLVLPMFYKKAED